MSTSAMAAVLAAAAKHMDSSPFWAGEGIGLVAAGIFVIFVAYVVVQRLRAGRKQKGNER